MEVAFDPDGFAGTQETRVHAAAAQDLEKFIGQMFSFVLMYYDVNTLIY